MLAVKIYDMIWNEIRLVKNTTNDTCLKKQTCPMRRKFSDKYNMYKLQCLNTTIYDCR